MVSSSKISQYSIKHPLTEPSSALFEFPIEALAFAVAGLVASFFKLAAAAALKGMSFGLLAAKLATKAMNRYHPEQLIELTKKACNLVRQYPKLQFISFTITLIISSFFRNLSLGAGVMVGGFNAIILDVERYKQIRQAK